MYLFHIVRVCSYYKRNGAGLENAYVADSNVSQI